jgi:hypothetical protein
MTVGLKAVIPTEPVDKVDPAMRNPLLVVEPSNFLSNQTWQENSPATFGEDPDL